MEIKRNELESSFLASEVYELLLPDEFDLDNLYTLEEQLPNGAYVFTKNNLDNVLNSEKLGIAGYTLAEVQISSKIRLFVPEENTKWEQEYECFKVNDELNLSIILEIAKQTLKVDRFSVDSSFSGMNSERRIASYLRKSFLETNEEIWAVKIKKNNEIISFRSHMKLDSDNCRLLLGSVAPKYLNLGVGEISWYFARQVLCKQNYRFASTVISAANKSVLNLEIAGQGFKVQNTKAIFRKIITK
jgi:hypothetical protein